MHTLIRPLLTAAFLLLIINTSNAQTVATVAGNGNPGFSGDGGPALQAAIEAPNDVALDNNGNLYICASNRLRKVNTSGIISSVAGNGNVGFSGDGGPAILADYKGINCVATDITGNIYVSDSHRIRKINSAGIVNTIVGTGVAGFSGDGGPATAAGNLYFSDAFNRRVRKINTSGIISTVAGNGTIGFSGDGGLATSAQLNTPYALAMDASGNLYIADCFNNRVRKVNTSGIITTVAGGGSSTPVNGISALSANLGYLAGLALDAAGNIYISSFTSGNVYKVNTSGTLYILSGVYQTGSPLGIAANAGGTVYVPDYDYHRVRKITPCSGPPILDTITGNVLVCANTQNYYYGSPTVYTELLNYMWSVPNGWTLVSNGGASIGVNTGSAGGNIILTATNLCGTSTYTLPVNIDNSIPVASVAATDTAICYPNNITLVAGAGAGYQYQWYFNNFLQLGQTNDSLEISQAGTYSVVVTNAAGCISDTSNAIVITQMEITMSFDTVLCPGEILTMSVNSTWANSYQWQFNNINIPGATSSTYTSSAPGAYNIILSGYGGCVRNSQVANITSAPAPVADITNYPDTILLCQGSSITLWGSIAGNQSCQWQFNGVDIPGAFTPQYTLSDTGTYSYIVTNYVTGCDSLATVEVVDGEPSPVISTSGIMPICLGDSILLEVNTGYIYYSWWLNGNIVASGPGNTYMATSPGTYSVGVSNGTCYGITSDLVVTTTATPTPIITQNGQQLSVPAIYTSYQWYMNGSPIAGATSDTYTPTQSGDYYIVVWDGGCDGPSDTINITLSVKSVISRAEGLKLYPNPNNGNFTFAVLSTAGTVTYQVMDITGRLIVSGEIPVRGGVANATVALPSVPGGLYNLRVSNGGEVYNIPFVKE